MQKKLHCHVTNLHCHGKKLNYNVRNINSKLINSYIEIIFLHIIAYSDVIQHQKAGDKSNIFQYSTCCCNEIEYKSII